MTGTLVSLSPRSPSMAVRPLLPAFGMK
jgi:hypothetical protein